MKFRLNAKPKKDLRVEHAWFAWRPVVCQDSKCLGTDATDTYIYDDRRTLVWLTHVHRRLVKEYRGLASGTLRREWVYHDTVCYY